jgi:hypothetical protein
LEAFLYYLLPHTIFTVFYNTFYYFLHYILWPTGVHQRGLSHCKSELIK